MTTQADPDAVLGDWGWFEDFAPGQRMRHARAATIGELEGSGLAKQVMNTSQAHFNDHFLIDSPLGDHRLVFGFATASLVYGLASQDTAEHVVAELGWDRIRFRAPVHHGDTIQAFTECLSVEPGERPSDPGTVTFRHWGRRQDRVIVFDGVRRTLVRRRPQQSSAGEAVARG